MTIALIRHRTGHEVAMKRASDVHHAFILLFVLFGFIGSTNTIIKFSFVFRRCTYVKLNDIDLLNILITILQMFVN